jgi:hypothetical protein
MILSAATRLTVASVALLFFGHAKAEEPRLSVSAGQTLQHESNIFRLGPGTDPMVILGQTSTGETVDITSLRLQYKTQFSLQEVDIDLGLVDYNYQRYNTLDLLARNYGLEWRWAITPRLRGKARAERISSVGSFDDAVGISSSNQRLRLRQVVDATYELDGVWRLLLAAQNTRNRFDQPLLGEDGTSLRSGEVGIRFDAPSTSSASLRWRKGTGRTLSGLATLSGVDNFEQSEWLIDLRLHASQKTVLSASLTGVSRAYTQTLNRDFSGTSASFAVNWEASAKSLWTARWSSDLSAYSTTGSSTARTNQIALSYQWSIGPRTRLQLGLIESRLRLGAAPLGVALNPLQNSTSEQSLGLAWAPTRNLALDALLVDTRRSGNTPDQRFSNLRTSVTATLSF